ncbi:RNA polymerase sigma factor [Paenibacillus tarimensis]
MKSELFRELYAAHSKKIFSYLFARTNNKESAADLLQDIFLKVWNRVERAALIPEEERLYWIFSIASNRLKDYYKKAANERNAEGKIESGKGHEPEDLSGLLASRERFRELESQIDQLPEELRCILLMKVIGGMNSSQIGIALQLPPGTVRYKLGQARRLLAGKLGLLENETAGRKGEVK